MSQLPNLPPAGGNSEVHALNELTLQIHQLNQNLESFQPAFDADFMTYGFLVVIFFFFAGFSLSYILGFVRSLVNMTR